MFDNILKNYMYQVDINELTPNQMLKTYENEKLIREGGKHIGNIGSRFECNLKDLAINKKYDLIYGHWCLGYL